MRALKMLGLAVPLLAAAFAVGLSMAPQAPPAVAQTQDGPDRANLHNQIGFPGLPQRISLDQFPPPQSYMSEVWRWETGEGLTASRDLVVGSGQFSFVMGWKATMGTSVYGPRCAFAIVKQNQSTRFELVSGLVVLNQVGGTNPDYDGWVRDEAVKWALEQERHGCPHRTWPQDFPIWSQSGAPPTPTASVPGATATPCPTCGTSVPPTMTASAPQTPAGEPPTATPTAVSTQVACNQDWRDEPLAITLDRFGTLVRQHGHIREIAPSEVVDESLYDACQVHVTNMYQLDDHGRVVRGCVVGYFRGPGRVRYTASDGMAYHVPQISTGITGNQAIAAMRETLLRAHGCSMRTLKFVELVSHGPPVLLQKEALRPE